MIFQLKRMIFSETDTIGALFDDKCNWLAWTLEDTYRKHKIPGETCIPYSMYRLSLYNSPKFTPVYGHKMIMLENVRNFEYILIHPGNTDSDTRGCILPANGVDPIQSGDNFIRDSRPAYDRIYPIIREAIERGNAYLNVTSI